MAGEVSIFLFPLVPVVLNIQKKKHVTRNSSHVSIRFNILLFSLLSCAYQIYEFSRGNSVDFPTVV